MTKKITNTAGALLLFAPTREVADRLVAERATLAQSDDSSAKLNMLPSTEALLANGDLAVLTAAARSPHAPPEFLEQLTGRTSVLLRTALAENPATPLAVQKNLFRWAVAEHRQAVIQALAGHMSVAEFIPLAKDSELGAQLPRWAEANLPLLTECDSVEEFRLAFDSGVPAFRTAAVLAADSSPANITTADLLSEMNAGQRLRQCVDAVNFAKGFSGQTPLVVERELINWCLVLDADPDAQLPAAVTGEDFTVALGAWRRLGAESVHAVLSSGSARAMRIVTVNFDRSDITEDQFDRLVDTVTPKVAESVLRALYYRPAEKWPDRAMRVLIGKIATSAGLDVGAQLARKVLKYHGAGLGDEQVLPFVCALGVSDAAEWLLGRYASKPTAGALRLWSAELKVTQVTRTWRRDVETMGELVTFLARRGFLGQPEPGAIDTVLNECGTYTLAALRSSTPWGTELHHCAAEYVSRRLTEAFGDDPDAWANAVQCAAALQEGTVDDFINMLRALS